MKSASRKGPGGLLALLALWMLVTPGPLAARGEAAGQAVAEEGSALPAGEEGEVPGAEPEADPEAPVTDEIVVTPSQFGLLRREPGSGDFLSGVEIDRLPHLADDLFRAVGRLPGLAGGDISAKFNVRGGDEDEVLVLVDGLEVYEPFHLKDFQSVFSIIDSEAVGGVDVTTGGFTSEYGGRLSGVIDVTTSVAQAPRRTELGVSFVNARVLSEGTVGDGDGRWLVSARRGYLDVVLDFVDPGGELDPTYYDALGKYEHRFGESTTLSGNVLAARDDVVFDSEDDDERADAAYGNAYVWLNLSSLPSARVLSRTVVSAGLVERDRRGGLDDEDVFADVRDERDLEVLGLRQDLGFDLGARHYLKAGFDVKSFEAEYDYRRRSIFRDPFTGVVLSDVVRESDVQPGGEAYGAYVADRVLLTDALAVELGVRWDQQNYLPSSDSQVSPRVNVAYQATERTALRAAWGYYHQPQRPHELQVEDGVETFYRAQRAEHQVVSLEHLFGAGPLLRLEAYRKEITDPRPRYENLFDPIELFPEAEADRVLVFPERARAEGVEITLRGQGRGRLAWWMSYAWSKAEDRIDGEWVPRSWDQEHAVQGGIGYQPGEKWSFNLYGIYHTGWPTTAVGARLGETPEGEMTIVPLVGPRNGERFDDYHRFDVRASRRVPLRRGAFTFFLEVINVLNTENTCCVDDFRFLPQGDGSVRVIRIEDSWLPILPSFGLAWEF